ncbi:ABC transporter ATP-binding protein [Crossiella cryophila]|uniref:Iron complex transport system ATP-binding protein n=1 Tax=Crossiella cryophila TaxID=43355 RepID=A0A7W7CLI6_9PSEU|nr:ABC transporter ATP-binding protein [Crossiella cryophila]MBB4681664.1 iron complex transport system ATP-binding protein [Crossiella cryophila]
MRPEVLRANGLAVGYRVRRRASTVLSEVDLGLHAGELVCLLGVNGTGKSTLMRTLAGMQPPLAGSVDLTGVPLAGLSRVERARRLAVVLTTRIQVGNLRGIDLVELGRAPYTGWSGTLGAADKVIVREALALAGAESLAERMLDELSDGERQRLMVARALAQQPDVLLLDEPTAFLDAPRRAELTAMLRGLGRATRLAVLLSTHDVELALRNADVVWLVLPGGSVVAGAPEDLVLDGVLERAFGGRDHTFDPLAGGFQVRAQTHGTARVTGAGDELTEVWTRRALQRCGYRIDDTAAVAEVEVGWHRTADGHRWKVSTPGGNSEHDSLAGVVDTVRRTPPRSATDGR